MHLQVVVLKHAPLKFSQQNFMVFLTLRPCVKFTVIAIRQRSFNMHIKKCACFLPFPSSFSHPFHSSFFLLFPSSFFASNFLLLLFLLLMSYIMWIFSYLFRSFGFVSQISSEARLILWSLFVKWFAARFYFMSIVHIADIFSAGYRVKVRRTQLCWQS